MSNEFEWVPFYEEMAKKLLEFRNKQSDLIKILKDAGVKDLTDQNPKGNKIPLNEIDPFSFTALIQKHSVKNIAMILEHVKKQLKIASTTPKYFAGIPSVYSPQAKLFPYKFERKAKDIEKLWDLYKEVVDGNISDSTFSAAKSVRLAGKAKLTQAMFRASPKLFFPVDGQTISYLARLGFGNKFKTGMEYLGICADVLENTYKPLYVHSYEAWLSNQAPVTEAQFQIAVLEKATSNEKINIQEPQGGIPKPPKTYRGLSSGYQRNPKVAATALKRAKFKCELDSKHVTFITSAKGVPYVEAHHLIPISKQNDYQFSLDVTGNIVALCPTCHRRLHHGNDASKKAYLSQLFMKRKKQLAEKKIQIDEQTLLDYYSDMLLEDDA